MQIYKNYEYIQINAEYGQYLTNKSATDDKLRVIVKSVNIPLEESTNDWEEITQDEVDRIRKASGTAMSHNLSELVGVICRNSN